MNDPEYCNGTCVLIIEDDDLMRMSLEDRLRLESIPVRVVSSAADAYQQLEKGDIDLVVTDIRLPDGSGIEIFNYTTYHYPGVPVILMTAYGDIATAVKLVKSGATDYLTKPFELDLFIEKLKRHLSRTEDIRLSAESLAPNAGVFKPGSGYLGKSVSMRKIERLVSRLRESDSAVLITGESGVGKEVIASLVHHNSPRKAGPLIRVNCAALSPGLVESELFGHEKGAFTGASERHLGRFEMAQGGTIFLDEIAEIPQSVQVKLLRVIQEKVVERVGGQTSLNLDVRVISATQVNLDKSIQNGQFRSDLYWRLNVIRIHIPPLHDRKEDILYLARKFLNEEAEKTGSDITGMTKEAESQLLTMAFPGNVRELKNIIERAVALCEGSRISENDLIIPSSLDEAYDQEAHGETLKESVEIAERIAIRNALDENNSVINRVAEALGISRKSLWEKMKRYGIQK